MSLEQASFSQLVCGAESVCIVAIRRYLKSALESAIQQAVFRGKPVLDAQSDRSDAAQWRPQTARCGVISRMLTCQLAPGHPVGASEELPWACQHHQGAAIERCPDVATANRASVDLSPQNQCTWLFVSSTSPRSGFFYIIHYLSLNEAVNDASLLRLLPSPIANHPRSYGEDGLQVSF